MRYPLISLILCSAAFAWSSNERRRCGSGSNPQQRKWGHHLRNNQLSTRIQTHDTRSAPIQARSISASNPADEESSNTIQHLEGRQVCSSPLSYDVNDLANLLEGSGRARAVWECYRRGIDPLCNEDRHHLLERACSRKTSPPSSKTVIGPKTLALLRKHFGGPVQQTIAETVAKTVSADGTTKLLMTLKQSGGDNANNKSQLQIETVIIPWGERRRSTLCVSSQVGCAQACTFCSTGRMGKLRSLMADEILSQVFAAVNVLSRNGQAHSVYPIDNVVFMGMGEPADNADQVIRAVHILTDPHCFALAPRRVTISTVAPTPEAFEELSRAPAVLAWSVHSSRDEVRKQLVPTARFSPVELREGLIRAMLNRSRRQRALMLEVTLLDGINDSDEDAHHLAGFCEYILRHVPGVKLVVNLIPWNDIYAAFGVASQYRKPSLERVRAFQRVLVEQGVLCYIRITRGDDKSAACGQLATKNFSKPEINVRGGPS